MSAILPYYADEEEAERPEHAAERAAARLSDPEKLTPNGEPRVNGTSSQRLAGLGDATVRQDVDLLAENALEAEALNTTHAGLLRQAWTRTAVADQMNAGKGNFVVSQVDGKVFITTDATVPGAAWELNPNRGEQVSVELLTWTSKMGCWSFSLPAGAPVAGGTCPGAVAGQSVSSLVQIKGQARRVQQVLGAPVSVADAICQRCYATGNSRYGRTNMIAKQTLLYAWTQAAVKDGSFAEVMTAAIKGADTLPNGGDRGSNSYLPERWPQKFFRIHDSGDFFSEAYVAAWKQVARNCPEFMFWAPTRIWALPEGANWIKRHNSDYNPTPGAKGSNLIIRPSNYHFNEHVPDKLSDHIDAQGIRRNAGSGFASWSTAFDKERKPVGGPAFDRTGGQRVQLPIVGMVGKSLKPTGQFETNRAPYDWDCQAYLSNGGTCRNACAPDGQIGCRMCWLNHDRVVNYTAH